MEGEQQDRDAQHRPSGLRAPPQPKRVAVALVFRGIHGYGRSRLSARRTFAYSLRHYRNFFRHRCGEKGRSGNALENLQCIE
jgi:hypothetical protein